jgi:PIN domain nuclease of toxin-antitoxin system
VEGPALILLDTHVWLWLALEPKKLSRPAAAAIQRAAKTGALAIASITLLEAAWLFTNGRIRSPGTVSNALRELVESVPIEILDLTPDVAATAVQLPSSVPADPADRLIVATAIVHGYPLVTRDERIQAGASCRTIW